MSRSTTIILPSSRPVNRSRTVPSLRQVFLSPFRSRVSSLPPSARANHVLLSRSPLSGVRPLRYRAQLVLRVRHESSFSSTTLSPFPPHADRRFGSRSCDGAGRSCCASLARSLARSCCAAFARAARALREAHAPFHRRAFSSLIQALSTISLGHGRFHYTRSLALSLSLARASYVSRLLSPTLTPFLRLLLTRRLLFLSYTRARGSPTASSLLLFRVSFSFVCVIPL